jgi:hypothetical protein
MASDEESPEEGDDADAPPSHFFLFAPTRAAFALSPSGRIAFPSITLDLHPIARLCPLRC